MARQATALVWVVEEASKESDDYAPVLPMRFWTSRAAARRERTQLYACFDGVRFRVAKYGRIGLDTNGPRKMCQRELFRSETR